MAVIHVPFLTRRERGGSVCWYWQPSPRLRKAGWKLISLGKDEEAAVKAAKAHNAEVAAWQAGGARPRAVKKFVAAQTVGAMIASYRTSDRYAALRASTRRVYNNSLDIIEAWAGDVAIAAVTRKRVQVFKAALFRPGPTGVVRDHRAAAVMRVGQTLWKFGVDEDLCAANPFSEAGVPTPAPRHQVWTRGTFDAICAAALRCERPTVALAVKLGLFIGQRPGDIIRVGRPQWQDRRIELRQRKTGKWVGVRAIDNLAEDIEAELARQDALAVVPSTIIINDETGLPYNEQTFIRHVRAAREEPAAPGSFLKGQAMQLAGAEREAALVEAAHIAAAVPPCPDALDVQFRDLRRTLVVWLGRIPGLDAKAIAGITCHSIDHTARILETFGPRDTIANDTTVIRLQEFWEAGGGAAGTAPEREESTK